MKCFTLQAKRDLIVGAGLHHPMTFIAPELYPEAIAGIKIACGKSDLELLPGLKACLSPELLQECKRDNSSCLVLERASTRQLANGQLQLIPEIPGDDQSALVLLDLGRGMHSSVRYEVGNRVYLRGRRQSDALFGSEELALVEVPVGRPFSAYRSSRRWWCFGGEVVGEQLQVRFDGIKLNCREAL